MGYSEVAGNGSVHWKVDHEDGAGKIKGKKDKGRPKGDHEVSYDDCIMGRDPCSKGIGKNGEKREKKEDHFDVRLRFGSREEAERALRDARISQSGGDVFVYLTVDATRRAHPDDPPAAEVRVDW
jgi:hypothetical protein